MKLRVRIFSKLIETLQHYVRQRRNKIANRLASKLVQWQLRSVAIWRKCRVALGRIAITLLTLAAIFSGLYFKEIRDALDRQSVETILSQLGATFGTILALVLTLSIIPVQRAGEVWSPSILRLYRRDPSTYVTFIVLGVFCVASFLFAVKGLARIPAGIVLTVAFGALGTSLDVLRWYHGHVCELLEPTKAVGLAMKYARQTIESIQQLVTRVAKLQYRALNTEQRSEISVEDLETAVYPRVPGYPESINFWINDLGEVAGKATLRREKFLAGAAVSAIGETTKYFLSTRKNNLIFFPDPEALFLVPKFDVEVVVNKAYEALLEISRTAVANRDESTAIRVSEALESIASHAVVLGARVFRSHSAPLTPVPISYLMSCVKFAQSSGLDEMPFQSAEILTRISLATPKDVSPADVHIPVVDGLYEIAIHLYTKRNAGLAEHVIGHMLLILDHLLNCEDFYFTELLRHVLEKLEILAPLAIISESLAGRIHISSPLGKAYALTNQQSLGYLLSKAAKFIKVDTERDWINPYHRFVQLMDVYWNHFRRLAETIEFGDSFLLWELNELIKHIVRYVAQLIDHPLRPGERDEVELIEKLKWILSFYWVAFHKKKVVYQQRVDEACETLAYTGLLFFDRGYPDVLKSCIEHITSIVESYCETTHPPNDYALGDFYAHLWSLRLLTAARGNKTLTQMLDEAMTAKPKPLTDEQWQQTQEAIRLRKRQLEERLAEEDRLRTGSAEDLLRNLLRSSPA